MRSKNSDWVIADSLDGLFKQDFTDFELLVMDSGSTDSTLDIVRRYPHRLIRVPPGDYVPGMVLNQGCKEAKADFIVFQNSDTIPLHPEALSRLVEPLFKGEADATFARQTPRPEAETWVRSDYARSFPSAGHAPEWLPYSLPFAAMTRKAWKRLPFYVDSWASEDTHWGVNAPKHGIRIQYVPTARVMHSHNYTLRQLHARRFVEGEADAWIYDDLHSPEGTFFNWGRRTMKDLVSHFRAGDWNGALATPRRQWVSTFSWWKGWLQGRRRRMNNDFDVRAGQKVIFDHYEDGRQE